MTQSSESPPPVADFDAAMYMDIMREDPPLKRYVSRGDMRDSIDIPGPHDEVDLAVFRVVCYREKLVRA
ncbi:MAG: hypothetical protein ACE5H4_12910 [Candidatus Thorarchaeota archaeon]